MEYTLKLTTVVCKVLGWTSIKTTNLDPLVMPGNIKLRLWYIDQATARPLRSLSGQCVGGMTTH